MKKIKSFKDLAVAVGHKTKEEVQRIEEVEKAQKIRDSHYIK